MRGGVKDLLSSMGKCCMALCRIGRCLAQTAESGGVSITYSLTIMAHQVVHVFNVEAGLPAMHRWIE